jgi:ribosomal protein S18 acetylase RimI-like enzyme
LKPAARQDLEMLVHILAASFDDAEEKVRAGILRNLADPSEHYYLAHLDGRPIGSIRPSIVGNDAYLYGFGVLPAYRGRGLGREILYRTIETLQAANHDRIGIEVETDNRNALSLYLSCGFREVTTYGYYHLESA